MQYINYSEMSKLDKERAYLEVLQEAYGHLIAMNPNKATLERITRALNEQEHLVKTMQKLENEEA